MSLIRVHIGIHAAGPFLARRVPCAEREFFIDNLLVRIHFIIEMIWWTGLAPCSVHDLSLDPADT